MLVAPTNGLITCTMGDESDDGHATEGDTCHYTCNNGYVLSGNATRICGNDGMWKGFEPTCKGNTISSATIAHYGFKNMSVPFLPTGDIKSNNEQSTGKAVGISITVTSTITCVVTILAILIFMSLYRKYQQSKPKNDVKYNSRSKNFQECNQFILMNQIANKKDEPVYATAILVTTKDKEEQDPVYATATLATAKHQEGQDPVYATPQLCMVNVNDNVELDPVYASSQMVKDDADVEPDPANVLKNLV